MASTNDRVDFTGGHLLARDDGIVDGHDDRIGWVRGREGPGLEGEGHTGQQHGGKEFHRANSSGILRTQPGRVKCGAHL